MILPRGLTEIPAEFFEECANLVRVDIPDTLKSIGKWAFKGCSSLRFLALPEGVSAIPENCFLKCSSLEEIVLPDSLTVLEGSALSGCSSLETLFLPESVSLIGMSAFKDCSSLKDVWYSGTWVQKDLIEIQEGNDCLLNAVWHCKGPQPVDIGAAEISSAGDVTYTGKALKPAVTVTWNGVTLVKNTDYSVVYENNTEPGTATIVITGLKKGRTYYVRIRAYKTVKGVKIYSAWSKAKKIAVK